MLYLSFDLRTPLLGRRYGNTCITCDAFAWAQWFAHSTQGRTSGCGIGYLLQYTVPGFMSPELGCSLHLVCNAHQVVSGVPVGEGQRLKLYLACWYRGGDELLGDVPEGT